VGTEFRRTADELSYGLPFREAMINMQRRFPIHELRFLVTAIVVQKESGGNLVDLLDRSAGLLRARIVLRQKIRVFSAQGRMTGWILGALPFVAFLALNYVRPGYSRPLFEDEMGRRLVYMALGAMGLGAILIRRIVNIKV
jgi:tight adherence protein B